MNESMQKAITAPIENFHLPAYEAIPDVGLYLEQTSKYISDYLAPLGESELTGSMISNYVKKGLIKSPVKKQYDREQIAQLIFIAVAKTVISIDDLHLMLGIQRRTYKSQKAYDYFCAELINSLHYVFGLKKSLDTVGEDSTDQKLMLRNVIITVAHKVYLNKLCAELQKEEARLIKP